MKRSNKRSLYCGPKGKFVIPKTTLALRKALAPNMAAARAALKIVSYHDECCAHASDYSKFAWKLDGEGEKKA